MTKKEPRVEMKWPVDRMRPHPDNPRTHPDDQVSGLASSFDEFGVLQFPVIDESGLILAGHGRWMAAQKQGRTDLPVIVVTGWSEEKKLAFMVADNRWAMLGGFDQAKLRAAVGQLQTMNYNLVPIGYTLEQAAELLSAGTTGQVDPDEVPPINKKPIIHKGDIWNIGHHRIACGDCTNADDVKSLIGNDFPLLMVTDPPYGVNYDPNWRNKAKRSNGKMVGAKALGRVQNDDRADWREAWALFPGDVAYVWHADKGDAEVSASLVACNFVLRAQIIFVKSRTILGRGDYHYNHEPCWYAVKKGRSGHWTGRRDQGTAWKDIQWEKNSTGHGTQKPVECMARPIRNNSRPSQFVYDPFVGSGTTIIAAEMEGRRCLAIDIDPVYVQVAIERWQTFTGKMATLDGIPFEEVATARRKGQPRVIKKRPPERALFEKKIEA